MGLRNASEWPPLHVSPIWSQSPTLSLTKQGETLEEDSFFLVFIAVGFFLFPEKDDFRLCFPPARPRRLRFGLPLARFVSVQLGQELLHALPRTVAASGGKGPVPDTALSLYTDLGLLISSFS